MSAFLAVGSAPVSLSSGVRPRIQLRTQRNACNAVKRAASHTHVSKVRLRNAVTVRASVSDVDIKDAGTPVLEGPFVGFKKDMDKRAPLYLSDWKEGLPSDPAKSIASVFFLFFAALAPAVAFGAVLSVTTQGMMGVTEVIIATAVGGVGYALLSGQPLSILASTGSVVTYTGILYATCATYGLPFFGTYAWIGIWTAAILMFCAVFSSSNLVRFFTKFTDETFAALVSCIFCYEAAKKIILMYFNSGVSSTVALGSTAVAVVTLVTALGLASYKRSPYGPKAMRNVIGDFAPTIAVGVGCLFASWLMGTYGFSLDTLSLPSALAPTTARPWLIDFWNVPNWVKLAAMIPAPACAVLLYMDQNITTRLVNNSKGLRKPEGYHIDMFWLSIITACTSVCGLPWICASTVHSVTHVKSLSETSTDSDGREVVSNVQENRWTPLLLNSAIGASIICLKPILATIPMCVLNGLFFYLGVSAMRGNDFIDRVRTFFITNKDEMPDTALSREVDMGVQRKFTAMQASCLGIMWWIKGSALAMLFPILIGALGPVRIIAAKLGWFTQKDLNALDEPVETDPAYAEKYGKKAAA